MTEYGAWREIARRRAESRRYVKHGLCYQIKELHVEGKIDTALAKWMLCRIVAHLPVRRNGTKHIHAYAADVPSREANAGRLLAALLFAEESEADNAYYDIAQAWFSGRLAVLL